jgi:hypothetical protein
MLNNEIKNKVATEVARRRNLFDGSDQKYATSLGINSAVYSRLKAGETERILSEQAWISLARKMEISLRNEPEWKTAGTPVFDYITAQLKRCQDNSISALICDAADIGKTYTARVYCKTHKNAIYIDCSQVKTRQKLIRQIAKEFGVGYTGRYNDVYEDLVFYLRSIAHPIIILDEAGDLDYPAFLEVKALWNATERCCGWMMMGADGLKEKIRRSIDHKKVGYTEIYSRYGKRYQRITPEGRDDYKKFIQTQAALIVQANAPGANVQALLRKTDGSLRRIYTEITKLN